MRIRKFYSFRPLPLMKGCKWMTYHLTVHTVIMHMDKKTTKPKGNVLELDGKNERGWGGGAEREGEERREMGR